MPVRFHRADEEAAIVPSGPLFTNNGDVVVPMLAAGGGIAMLPDFIAETELASGALVRTLADRSEEHTSELQSLMRISYAVFCLTKKNQKPNNLRSAHHIHTSTQTQNVQYTNQILHLPTRTPTHI